MHTSSVRECFYSGKTTLGNAVCRDYSPPGRSGSTSTMPCDRVLRLLMQACTSPTPRVRVPRHVARLVTGLVAPLVVDYSPSHRLVVDYFAYAARPGASTRRAARHAARRAARTPPRAGSSSTTSPTPRVKLPRHVTRLVTRLVAPLVVDYFASRRLVVDYLAYAARPVASARRAARRAACRRLLRLAQARR
jgi:hypothetical protein